MDQVICCNDSAMMTLVLSIIAIIMVIMTIIIIEVSVAADCTI